MCALRNIRLEWHFLGVFEYAQAQNVGHFSWKQSVTNGNNLGKCLLMRDVLVDFDDTFFLNFVLLIHCMAYSVVCIWIVSIGLSLGCFLFLGCCEAIDQKAVIIQRAFGIGRDWHLGHWYWLLVLAFTALYGHDLTRISTDKICIG